MRKLKIIYEMNSIYSMIFTMKIQYNLQVIGGIYLNDSFSNHVRFQWGLYSNTETEVELRILNDSFFKRRGAVTATHEM